MLRRTLLAAVPALAASLSTRSFAATGLAIEIVPTLRDNYTYCLRDEASGAVAVVDPGEADPVAERLDRLGWRPTSILCTHHHWDHVGGVEELARRFGAEVVGPAIERDRIPAITRPVGEGDTIDLGARRVAILSLPGHTPGHVAFHMPEEGAVFTGDTLFVLGCGKIGESGFEAMWESLRRLRALPPETRVFCGHEYAQPLSRFARHLTPRTAALAARVADIDAARAEGRPSVPSTIGLEARTNPYLRLDDPELLAALGLDGAEPAAVYQELVKRWTVARQRLSFPAHGEVMKGR